MRISEILPLLPQYIRPSDLPNSEHLLHFVLSGQEPCDYSLWLGKGKARVEAGLLGKADCRIACSSALLLQIIKGEKDPKAAYLLGRLKISSLSQMLKVAPLLLSLYQRHKEA